MRATLILVLIMMYQGAVWAAEPPPVVQDPQSPSLGALGSGIDSETEDVEDEGREIPIQESPVPGAEESRQPEGLPPLELLPVRPADRFDLDRAERRPGPEAEIVEEEIPEEVAAPEPTIRGLLEEEGLPETIDPPVFETKTPWRFALTTGYYSPSLRTLNRVLDDTSITILQDPNFLLPRNAEFPFEARNPSVAGISGGVTFGVEAFYNPEGAAHALGFSFSSWHGETIGQDRISLFLRSNIPAIEVPRSARYNIVLDRLFLEWRYYLYRDRLGRGVYLNFAPVGVSAAFMTMDALVNVVHPLLSFASVSSDEAFGWAWTTRYGVGGDYHFAPWLSIGGQANYILATIRSMQVSRHFSAGFPVNVIPNPFSIRAGVALPQIFFDPLEGRTVTHANVTTTQDIEERAGPATPLLLELSGFEGILNLTIHF